MLAQSKPKTLNDLSSFKHTPSSFQRKKFSVEEIETINSGGQTVTWKKIKKIKIVKEEDE